MISVDQAIIISTDTANTEHLFLALTEEEGCCKPKLGVRIASHEQRVNSVTADLDADSVNVAVPVVSLRFIAAAPVKTSTATSDSVSVSFGGTACLASTRQWS